MQEYMWVHSTPAHALMHGYSLKFEFAGSCLTMHGANGQKHQTIINCTASHIQADRDMSSSITLTANQLKALISKATTEALNNARSLSAEKASSKSPIAIATSAEDDYATPEAGSRRKSKTKVKRHQIQQQCDSASKQQKRITNQFVNMHIDAGRPDINGRLPKRPNPYKFDWMKSREANKPVFDLLLDDLQTRICCTYSDRSLREAFIQIYKTRHDKLVATKRNPDRPEALKVYGRYIYGCIVLPYVICMQV